MRRYMSCGKDTCHCLTSRGHGPYFEWTRKQGGKTLSTRVSPQTAKVLAQWIRNDRKAKLVLENMRKLAARIIKAGTLLLALVALGCATTSGRRQAKAEKAPDPFFEERAAAVRQFTQTHLKPAFIYAWTKMKGSGLALKERFLGPEEPPKKKGSRARGGR